MGGDAFWHGAMIWLTVIPLLAFAAAVAATKLILQARGKAIGWVQATLYVGGVLLLLQLAGSVIGTVYFLF